MISATTAAGLGGDVLHVDNFTGNVSTVGLVSVSGLIEDGAEGIHLNVVTGDVTQVDLPNGRSSGLVESSRILADVDGIEVIRFGKGDVVRHDLVMKIVQAYERESERAEGKDGGS